MHSSILWFNILFDLVLPTVLGVLLFFNYRRRIRLKKQRDVLLQEKEATLGFVHHVGEIFADADSVDMDILLERALHYAVRTCKASAGAIHLFNEKTHFLEARAVSGVFPPPFKIDIENLDLEKDATRQLTELVKRTLIAPGKGLIGEACVQGNSILIQDAEMDSRIPQLPFDFLKVYTLLLVPMRFGNHTVGVMTLVNRASGDRFSTADLNLAQALAAQASVPIHYAELQESLDEKRQMDRDMHIAQQIQLSLLPKHIPTYPTVELAAFSHPAMDIGGDYYDIVTIDEKRIGLAIADVSGKGIGGALMMAVCRNVLRANAQDEYDPASMLRALNKSLSDNLADDMFISMIYMVLNLETNRLSYARAGHEPPIIIRNGKSKADRTQSAGIAIGLADNDTFADIIETRRVTLKPGDTVLTYTDGITEAMDGSDREWGIDNLVHTVERMAKSSAHVLINRIHENVLAFTGNRHQNDDMTMLAIKIKGMPDSATATTPSQSTEESD